MSIALKLICFTCFFANLSFAARPHFLRSRQLNSIDLSNVLSRYFNNEELAGYMQGVVSKCGNAARLFSYGKSSKGNPLYALEIYAGTADEEDRPSFKYTGALHGDEPSGRQLLIALAEHLCSAFTSKSDPFIVNLINRVSIVIIPSANPDGYAVRSRANGQQKDLNRDFPDPIRQKGQNLKLPLASSAPETQSMMSLMDKRRFIGALDLHEGAMVANYPLDGYPDGMESIRNQANPSPDDETFVSLAKLFASLHKTMSTSREFPHGITNGARWYPIYGGMQDWSYFATGTFSIVLELNDNKWPDPKRLAQMWDECREAFVKYPAVLVLGGISGIVMNSATKAPIGKATIRVLDGATGRPRGINVTSRGSKGDFYRPLAPGTYSVVVEAEGYVAVKVDQVVVPPFLSDKQGVQLSIGLTRIGGNQGTDPTPPNGNNNTDGVLLVPSSQPSDVVSVQNPQPGISTIGVALYVLGIPLAGGVVWLIWRRSYPNPTA